MLCGTGAYQMVEFEKEISEYWDCMDVNQQNSIMDDSVIKDPQKLREMWASIKIKLQSGGGAGAGAGATTDTTGAGATVDNGTGAIDGATDSCGGANGGDSESIDGADAVDGIETGENLCILSLII